MLTAIADLWHTLPWFIIGTSILGVVYLVFHGVPATVATLKNIGTAASADVAQVHSVLTADVGWLVKSVEALASHTGATLPPKAAAPKPAPAPAAPAA